MAIICTKTHELDARFTRNWSANGLEYTTEASDLGRCPFGRVYDDAADEGFKLLSPRTGQEIVLAVNSVKRNADNEIQWWDLRPVGALPAHLRDLNMLVRVYND